MRHFLLVIGIAFGLIGNLFSASTVRLDALDLLASADCGACACGGDCCVEESEEGSSGQPLLPANFRSVSEIHSPVPEKRGPVWLANDTTGVPLGTIAVVRVEAPTVPLFLSFQVFLI